MRPASLLKALAFRYTSIAVPRYEFGLEPIQLANLVLEMDRLKEVRGTIVEIGVARGMTTRFICEHIVRSGCTDQRLCAIDTFSSFLSSDVEYEVKRRGKKKSDFDDCFAYNDFAKWKKNFPDFPFVEAIQGDCSTFDYSAIAPIKLAVLDVDLYLPTKRSLPAIYEHLCEEGAIIVDDVKDAGRWDGAYSAYMEFCRDLAIVPSIIGNRGGVIRKQKRL